MKGFLVLSWYFGGPFARSEGETLKKENNNEAIGSLELSSGPGQYAGGETVTIGRWRCVHDPFSPYEFRFH